ncbi:phage tail protein [Photobacterium sp. 1_MG-2023]|uniref:phage tail-collar fiber domain-containing protein n=1 Tax=Photobacterium sp. 1_MG-2023 TaxID=3062646 RepID=UPI0026E3C070|nr:phage tail protein [Photobacterium sp. 1_MG-2023]MDO6706136.1 phage tail protein [Photobacterium sp. 1_MG-2023]
MSQTAIPFEFERYLQSQISAGKGPDMNEMIFAYIPGLNASQPIDRNQGLPPSSQWVHRQDIDQLGKMGDNALAYSVVISGSQPAFTFNAIFLRDKSVAGSCGFVVHKAQETKELGSALTRTLVMEYNGAAALAGVTVDAGTWQIDFSARLLGMDEDHRLACLDNYGQVGFIRGFDVIQQADPNKYSVTSGVAYVGGLRAVLANDVLQTVSTKPNALWLDVYRDGTSLSKWVNHVSIIASGSAKSDYTDSQGRFHYVAKIADIAADGSVVDRRKIGGLPAHLTAVDPHPQYGKKEKFHFSNHFQRIAILLVPYAELSTRFEESFVTGRLTMARGSKDFSERLGDFEISVKSSYNETSFTMMVYRRGWRLEFCALEYEGQKWLALYDTNAEWFNSQDAHVTFLGERELNEPTYDKHLQFKVISFASSTPSAPASNPEVFDTIVPLNTHNPQDAKGNQFYSKNFPPVVGNIDGLPEALNAKLPVDSLVGSIVEFSTDKPRTGYVKAQRVELSRLAYPKLWAVVQDASNLTEQAVIDASPQLYAGHYGTGDGVSTFTTPDYHLGHYRRGAEADEVFASTLESAVEYHNHGLPTSASNTSTAVSYGVPDNVWVAVDHYNFVLPGGIAVVTADVGQEAAGQRKGNFDDETRPKTLMTHVYIYHGEAA